MNGNGMSDSPGRTPSSGRDAGWLVGADLLAVGLAFLGQILLARTLAAESYGWMVLAIDLYASLFLVVDLGLPTLIARDGAHAPSMVAPAVKRTYRWQALAAVPFVLLTVVLHPDRWLNIEAPTLLLVVAGAIALVHVASYAPRSGLRALGEARLEAQTKVVERAVTVGGYAVLAAQGSTSVTAFAGAFLLGATAGWLLALGWLWKVSPPASPEATWTDLSASWSSTTTLLMSALPFAITLGVLPYVIRLEKFLVAYDGGAELAAVFHVAQLAWLAGLVVPAAMRSALLPVLGRHRHEPVRYQREMNQALDMCFGLLPVGLFGGYAMVALLAPLAFPQAYLDGTYGASAVDLFAVLLAGWALTLLATPTYTSLMAGPQPWRFTQFIFTVLAGAVVFGYLLVVEFATADGVILYAAAVASALSAGVLLVLSWWMSRHTAFVRQRRDEWTLALLGSAFIVVGLVTSTFWWVLGLPLFCFTPQGWRAVRSTLR
jgi:O-antigen/teichoic acid export membrane protein